MVQNSSEKLYLAVEIGGTKQQIAIGNKDGEIIELLQTKMIFKNGAIDILEWLKVNIRDLINKNDYKDKVHKIGVGFGGPLESSTGRVLSSLQVPGWENFKLKEWFEENFKLPTEVINDTVAGGFGELICGAGKDSKNFFYTNIGTGIGGGLYIDRKYYDGIGYGASYLGNTLVPDWTSNAKGGYTRMELICSGQSIEKRLGQAGYIPESSLLYEMCKGDLSKVTCVDLSKAVTLGDKFASEELDRIAKSFSIALTNCLALVSPDTITIGGGVAKMGEILFKPIEKHTEALAFIANKNRYKIKASVLMDNAVIVGSILYAANRDKMK